MMRPLILLATTTLIACEDPGVGTDPAGGEPETPAGREPVPSMSGNQSGSEDILICHEAARELIQDPSVPAQGALMASDDYLSRLQQTWSGTATLQPGEDPVPVTVTMTPDPASLSFVVYADEGWLAGDPVPYGDEDMCDDRYEVDVVMHVTAGTQLDELVSTTARGFHTHLSMFAPVELAAADVVGDLTPTAFDLTAAPAPWLWLSWSTHSSGTQLQGAWFEDIVDDDTDHPIIEDYGVIDLTP